MKKTVNKFVFEDMKRNVEGFNPDDYDVTDYQINDPEVIDFLREYYDSHLPVDADAWVRINDDKEKLSYGVSTGEQASLISSICWMLTSSYVNKITLMVIAVYYPTFSKKPIYQFEIKEFGIKVTIKADGCDWIISIDSPKPLDYDFMELFDPSFKEYSFTKTDMPREYTFGSFEENKSKFTIQINSQYKVYTFFYLLKHYLNIRKLMRVGY